MSYATTKHDAHAAIELARSKYLEKILLSDAFKALKAELSAFENGAGAKPFDDLSTDEEGLVCRLSLTLDSVLCQDEEGNGDVLLAEEVLQAANESLHYTQDCYSRGYDQWTAEQCFGEPAIVNENPERNCYAVFCRELDLAIDRIKSEEHGLMLVEQAMRKHGVFPWVVSCDRNGSCFSLSIPKEIINASDADLAAMIEKAESEE